MTDMRSMFENARGLISLDLSNWNTNNARHMSSMFRNTSSLRQLTLGENFRFVSSPALPAVPRNTDFTGRWQNVGEGTVANPLGTYVLTSAQLMQNLGATALPDTWVWHRPIARFHDDTGVLLAELPIVNGHVEGLIPTPPTRYGTADTPGQVFMGWFTEITPLMHYINNPNRAAAFDITQPITEDMLTDGVLNLYGSWLQFGDVNGDGRVNMVEFNLFQRFMIGDPTAILGVPEPQQP